MVHYHVSLQVVDEKKIENTKYHSVFGFIRIFDLVLIAANILDKQVQDRSFSTVIFKLSVTQDVTKMI